MTYPGPDPPASEPGGARAWTPDVQSWRDKSDRHLDEYVRACESATEEPGHNAVELLRKVRTARVVGVELDPERRFRIALTLVRLALNKGARSGGGTLDMATYLEETDPESFDGRAKRRQLTLSRAYLYSRVDSFAAIRGDVLEQARQLCRTNHERIEVEVVFAQYQVDVCEYRAAARLLADCRRTVRRDRSCVDMLPEIVVGHASLLFAQGRLSEARRGFRRTLTLMARLHRDPSERPAVKAHHYLGKIHSLYGRHDRAIDCLVHAEALVGQRRNSDVRQSAHNHSRLGVVLRLAGCPEHEVDWHLRRARELFQTAGDDGSGLGLQAMATAATRAGHDVRPDRPGSRAELYTDFVARASRNSHHRGVVIGETHLALLATRRRDWGYARRHARTAARSGLKLLYAAGVLPAVAGVVQLVAAFTVRTVRRICARTLVLRAPRCRCRHCQVRGPGGSPPPGH